MEVAMEQLDNVAQLLAYPFQSQSFATQPMDNLVMLMIIVQELQLFVPNVTSPMDVNAVLPFQTQQHFAVIVQEMPKPVELKSQLAQVAQL